MSDAIFRPTVCHACGAATKIGESSCWLCGAHVENPFKAPDFEPAPQPPFGFAKLMDDAIFSVVLLFVALVIAGYVINDSRRELITFLAGSVPWAIGYWYARSRQTRNHATGFWASKTFAMITGWAAMVAATILLFIGLIVLLFIICTTAGMGGFH